MTGPGEEIAHLVVRELAGQEAVLAADETGRRSPRPTASAPAASTPVRSKTSDLCQVAVHLAAVTESVRVAIDRALHLPRDRAADEERRKAAGVPDGIMFATKLQQTERASAALKQQFKKLV
jgi:SRSO17 transposase